MLSLSIGDSKPATSLSLAYFTGLLWKEGLCMLLQTPWRKGGTKIHQIHKVWNKYCLLLLYQITVLYISHLIQKNTVFYRRREGFFFLLTFSAGARQFLSGLSYILVPFYNAAQTRPWILLNLGMVQEAENTIMHVSTIKPTSISVCTMLICIFYTRMCCYASFQEKQLNYTQETTVTKKIQA